MPERAMRVAFPVSVAAVVSAFAALLAWNAVQYDWLRGYDAWQNWRYEQVIQHGNLPGRADTDEWHNPPLFYAVARVVQGIAHSAGLSTPEKAVQFIGVVSALGLAVLVLLIARELFPRSRTAQLGALAFVVTTPVLVRGSVMYHPEPLASLLVAAGTYVLVRALARRPPDDRERDRRWDSHRSRLSDEDVGSGCARGACDRPARTRAARCDTVRVAAHARGLRGLGIPPGRTLARLQGDPIREPARL